MNEAMGLISNEPVLRRQARALIGWMPEPEAIAALLGRNPLPDEPTENIRAEIARARHEVSRLRNLDLEDPIVAGDEDILNAIAKRQEIAANFPGMKWKPAFVDLRKVISFQKIIYVDGLDERVGGSSDVKSLVELCIPSEQAPPPLGAFTDPDGKGFTISSFNPNLRIAGGQLSEAQVSPAPGLPAVRMQAVTMLVYMGTSYLQVARYRGRSFIRDGYHRAAGLIKRGIHSVPCIFVEADSFEQVGALAGAFTFEVLYGDRPPLVMDFWNEAVTREVSQLAVRKVVRVRGEEFVVPR
jgi:hypothetical protein